VHIGSKGDLEWAGPMKEFLLLMAPLATVIYFLVYQDQFTQMLSYIALLID
jgi:hypothetical protein